MCDEIVPGAAPSYQLCREIYCYHALGKKLVDSPIAMAQSQPREIAVPAAPDRVAEAFEEAWKNLGADRHIANVMRTSRIYGIGSIAVLDGEETDPAVPLDYAKISDHQLSFNVLDPLNTAGSLVLDQNPNSPAFQKVESISVAGKHYHRSRAAVVLNEDPLYIEYTTSAFGFVGRSVYQRALLPLKTYVQSMITDDMIVRKVGVLIAKQKQAGSAIDQAMAMIAGLKRSLLKEAETDNVLSIGLDEDVESLNFQNAEGPYALARKNLLENVATSADMPAVIINSETFAEGFGEGTEDAKRVASYVDRVRIEMAPLYAFFDPIVQRKAWTPDFYKTIQAEFPEEYGDVDFNEAFYRWSNSFAAEWPSLLTEPESEQIKVDDVRLKAVVAMIEVLAPKLDPENMAITLKWAQENFNQRKLLFQTPLELDFDALREYVPPEPAKEPDAPKPFADSERVGKALAALSDAVGALPSRVGGKSPPPPAKRS